MSAIVNCKNCKSDVEVPDNHNRPFIQCPSCKRMVTVSLPARPAGAAPMPAAPRPAAAPPRPSAPPLGGSPAPAPAGAAGQEPLPELMKANKRIAGRKCVSCGAVIQLGEAVHNCPSCAESNHQDCWNRKGGCGNPNCSPAEEATEPAAAPMSRGPATMSRPTAPRAGAMGGAMMDPGGEAQAGQQVPCRWCKEPIMRGARKCKHCGEFQRDEDREAQAPMVAGTIPAEVSAVDWFFIICCPMIAIIIGLVRMLSGNPSGAKMIGYAAIWFVTSNILFGVLGALGGR